MKECPILFSGAMVRALLDGRKTQTRRIVKAKPSDECPKEMWPHALKDIIEWREQKGRWFGLMGWSSLAYADCPYGQPGDRLWVRESFFAYGRWETRFSEKKRRDEWHFIDMTVECDRLYQYVADAPDIPLAKNRGGVLPGWYRRPAIFMPRAASRITLEMSGVRVERLQDITEADAIAEGVEFEHITDSQTGEIDRDAVEAYEALWDSLNTARGYGWSINLHVWVVEFRRIES